MMRTPIVTALLLTGCATGGDWTWHKPNSSATEFDMEAGQCRAQAFSVPFARSRQIVLVYDACMQGKGWQKIPK